MDSFIQKSERDTAALVMNTGEKEEAEDEKEEYKNNEDHDDQNEKEEEEENNAKEEEVEEFENEDEEEDDDNSNDKKDKEKNYEEEEEEEEEEDDDDDEEEVDPISACDSASASSTPGSSPLQYNLTTENEAIKTDQMIETSPSGIEHTSQAHINFPEATCSSTEDPFSNQLSSLFLTMRLPQLEWKSVTRMMAPL